MDLNKKIKLLVLLLNKRGIEVSYTTVSRYSEKYSNMSTTYTLTFWYKRKVEDKKTGEIIQKPYPVVKDFSSMVALVRYLTAIKDDKKVGD